MSDAPLKLTNRQIARLAEGLKALDGVVSDGGKITRFKLDSDTAWNIAVNIEIVDQAIRIYERAKKTLGEQYGVVERMELTPQNAPNVASYIAAEDVLQDKIQDLGLHIFSRKTLQEKNAIPPSVLANLKPILTDE